VFLAIDRVSKFVHVASFDANTRPTAPPSCARPWPPSPTGRLRTVLTDTNGMAFAEPPEDVAARRSRRSSGGGHVLDRVRREHARPQHRLTKPYHLGRRMRLNSPFLTASCYFLRAHGRPRGEEPGVR
jgi:hypothetical protein